MTDVEAGKSSLSIYLEKKAVSGWVGLVERLVFSLGISDHSVQSRTLGVDCAATTGATITNNNLDIVGTNEAASGHEVQSERCS